MLSYDNCRGLKVSLLSSCNLDSCVLHWMLRIFIQGPVKNPLKLSLLSWWDLLSLLKSLGWNVFRVTKWEALMILWSCSVVCVFMMCGYFCENWQGNKVYLLWRDFWLLRRSGIKWLPETRGHILSGLISAGLWFIKIFLSTGSRYPSPLATIKWGSWSLDDQRSLYVYLTFSQWFYHQPHSLQIWSCCDLQSRTFMIGNIQPSSLIIICQKPTVMSSSLFLFSKTKGRRCIGLMGSWGQKTA